MNKIAILGATSHISKGLICNFAASTSEYELFLFARDLDKVNSFLTANNVGASVKTIYNIDGYKIKGIYDVIINCIGMPAQLFGCKSNLFLLTEEFDNLILNYLFKHPDTLYLNMSSGAAYCSNFTSTTDNAVTLNSSSVLSQEYYGLLKLNSETKHRSMPDLNIVDLRIFGYISQYIDLNACYLLTEIVMAIKNRSIFSTSSTDIYRDFVHPKDLFQLIELCIKKKTQNLYYDVYSLKPVSKFEIIAALQKKYPLEVAVKNSESINSTGIKPCYYSKNHNAEGIGYCPKYSSLECVEEMVGLLLQNR